MEVFDDLAVADQVLAAGLLKLPQRTYRRRQSYQRNNRQPRPRPGPEIPYPIPVFIPQYRTEGILRDQLARYGVRVELDHEVLAIEQGDDDVSVTIAHQGSTEEIHAECAVGCDGGRSTIRHLIGLSFRFAPNEEEKWTWVGDVLIDGLERGFVHRWNDPQRGMLMLSPFKDTELWQFQFLPADGAPPLPEPDQDKFRHVWAAWTGSSAERLHGTRTASRFRINEHIADHYRVGRVFLAGDAAHIYSPAGGQGMTTGIRDAYNLGWKVAAVLAGAPSELLETYEAERKPVAEYAMRRSHERWKQVNQAVAAQGDSPMWQLVINEDTSQLNVTYRSGPLAAADTEQGDALRPGDRAPDGVFQSAESSEPIHLFDVFRGPHWTVLLFGEQPDRPTLPTELWGAPVRTRRILDHTGSYAFTADTALVVRPDGYIARITHPDNLTDSSSLLAINA